MLKISSIGRLYEKCRDALNARLTLKGLRDEGGTEVCCNGYDADPYHETLEPHILQAFPAFVDRARLMLQHAGQTGLMPG